MIWDDNNNRADPIGDRDLISIIRRVNNCTHSGEILSQIDHHCAEMEVNFCKNRVVDPNCINRGSTDLSMGAG